MNDQQVEKVLEMLMGADFERWYENEFMGWVEGSCDLVEGQKRILADLKKMLESA